MDRNIVPTCQNAEGRKSLRNDYPCGRRVAVDLCTVHGQVNQRFFNCADDTHTALADAHVLFADRVFLDKAVELVRSMEPVFNTKSGVPFSDVNPSTGRAHPPQGSRDSSKALASHEVHVDCLI